MSFPGTKRKIMAVSRLLATESEETWACNGGVKKVANIPTQINDLVIKNRITLNDRRLD